MARYKTTRTVFLRTCDCGTQMEISKGRAGISIRCLNCGTVHQLCGLREMNMLPSFEKRMPSPASFQFSIRGLLLLFLPVAGLAWMVANDGLQLVLHFFIGLVLPLTFVLSIKLFFDFFAYLVARFWDLVEGQ